MNREATGWFTRRTTDCAAWPIPALLDSKGANTISVVIPARNEAATVGSIVRAIRTELVESVGLVDEIVVIDSDSTDDTARIAADGGAIVHASAAIQPDLGTYRGKGEALWKSMFVTRGDILVFVDADLTGWGPHFVTGLVGPLLSDPATMLVKGFYDRLLDDGSDQHAPQGGRVTELVARPLINLRWPELAAVVQPLAGEWAIRREAMARCAVPVAYGVELAVLLDIVRIFGLDAVAQVDLGERAHSHQSVHDLAVMAAEIIWVADQRAGALQAVADPALWQYDRSVPSRWRRRSVPVAQRPPHASLEG